MRDWQKEAERLSAELGAARTELAALRPIRETDEADANAYRRSVSAIARMARDARRQLETAPLSIRFQEAVQTLDAVGATLAENNVRARVYRESPEEGTLDVAAIVSKLRSLESINRDHSGADSPGHGREMFGRAEAFAEAAELLEREALKVCFAYVDRENARRAAKPEADRIVDSVKGRAP